MALAFPREANGGEKGRLERESPGLSRRLIRTGIDSTATTSRRSGMCIVYASLIRRSVLAVVTARCGGFGGATVAAITAIGRSGVTQESNARGPLDVAAVQVTVLFVLVSGIVIESV